MALEFICARSMKNNKKINIPKDANEHKTDAENYKIKINIPKDANVYEIDTENYKINFYHSNPSKIGFRLHTWKTPLNATEIEFEMRTDRIGGYIIIPSFYDRKGNLLKIGNR